MAARSKPELAEHARVVRVLEALDGRLLSEHGIVFAGGTRLALAYGEYRVSRDLDLLATDRPAYASVRQHVREVGLASLFVADLPLELPREAKMDQYGIRFPAKVDGESVKVEIVAEGTHQGLDNDCPQARAVEPPLTGGVVELSRLGGLHHRVHETASVK